MKLTIELGEDDIRKAVKSYIEEIYSLEVKGESLLTIETKSKQNYKSEWENAQYRARFEAES